MLKVGQEVTVAGVCKGGRVDLAALPGELQLWRVAAITEDRVDLEPLLQPGVVDAFAAVTGCYSLVLDPTIAAHDQATIGLWFDEPLEDDETDASEWARRQRLLL